MKALLNDCKTWVEIDPAFLADNQYNTTDGKRIFDRDIKAIRDDARHNMGVCRYCGAIVKRGEEEKHFTERETRGCAGCFWYRERVAETWKRTENTRDGYRIKTTVETLENVCAYCESSGRKADCSNKECREYGIKWFTPENTFFLAFPNGLEDITNIEELEGRGFEFIERLYRGQYKKKIGSYSLTATITYKDGKPAGVRYFTLSNCRRCYNFRIIDGAFYTDKYSFGFRRVKTLEGIPAPVIKKIKEVCGDVD